MSELNQSRGKLLAQLVHDGAVTATEAMSASTAGANMVDRLLAQHGLDKGDIAVGAMPENQPAGVHMDDVLASASTSKTIPLARWNAMPTAERQQLTEAGYTAG
jgi:hypothetical protein